MQELKIEKKKKQRDGGKEKEKGKNGRGGEYGRGEEIEGRRVETRKRKK